MIQWVLQQRQSIYDRNCCHKKMVEDCCWEACFSVPLTMGNVRRYCHIQVTYQNENGDIIQEKLEGWPARVWQHKSDHLNGLLYDDPKTGKCLQREVFLSKEEVLKFRQTT